MPSASLYARLLAVPDGPETSLPVLWVSVRVSMPSAPIVNHDTLLSPAFTAKRFLRSLLTMIEFELMSESGLDFSPVRGVKPLVPLPPVDTRCTSVSVPSAPCLKLMMRFSVSLVCV